MSPNPLIAALRDVRRVIEQATVESAAGALGSITMIVNRALSPENVTLFEGVPAGSEPTPVRPTDPTTSRDAAAAIVPKLTNQRGKCLTTLRGTGGLTASQVEQRTGLPSSSVSKRLGELERAGFVWICGTRPSVRGAEASVYQLDKAGVDWLEEHGLLAPRTPEMAELPR
jgi:DNA-binding transcriptional ArsR family regulator